MPITDSPFVLDDVSLTLMVAGGSTPQEYRCQLNRAELVPSANNSSSNTMETFCATHTGAGSLATWVLELQGFQAYKDAADLSMFLFDHEGEEIEYVMLPEGGVPAPDNPGFTGSFTAVPTNIGGTARQYAEMRASQPCTGKPDKLVGP